MTSSSLSSVCRLALRTFASSAWLYPSDELDFGRSWIVVAPHQSMLDVPTAVLVSKALHRDVAVWADPDILGVAPFLRSNDFLETPTDPAGFRQLIARSRELLRSQTDRALWVFPQGKCFHRSADMVLGRGVEMLRRACPEVPVVVAGIDYSIHRAARPHCVVELTPYDERSGDLASTLARATHQAGLRAAGELPTLVPPKLPLSDVARYSNRGRRWWTTAAFGS